MSVNKISRKPVSKSRDRSIIHVKDLISPTVICSEMGDPLAQFKRIYSAGRVWQSGNRIRFEVEGAIASVQIQGQQCTVTVRNSVGVAPVLVRRGTCPDYCWTHLVSTKPYCSRVKIVGEMSPPTLASIWRIRADCSRVKIVRKMSASDSAPNGVETKIISVRESYGPRHWLESLTYGSRGRQLPKLDDAILKYVNKYPRIKQADLIRKIHYENSTTIRKHLHGLVQDEKIKQESDWYVPVDYNFGSRVAALYCEGGSIPDMPDLTRSRGQSVPHKLEAKPPLEMIHSCIDKNIKHFKLLQDKLPEYDFEAKWTILYHVSSYPDQLDEIIEEEANYDGRDRYSIKNECTIMCDAILYELHNSKIRDDVECMLKYTVERILEYILPVDTKAQKLKYGNTPKIKHKSKRLKDLDRELKDGLDDLWRIQNKLKCRLVLSEFKETLERLQEKYQKLYHPPDTGKSKKAPKPQAAKQFSDLESKITELIIQDPGIRQHMIMEKFEHECPKTTIERRLKNLQEQRKVMRLPGYKARYVVTDCGYTQDMEKLLTFHIGRIVDYLEGVKAKMPDYTDAVKLSILEHMVSGYYKKINEKIKRRTTKLNRAFREINEHANEVHHLLDNNRRIAEKQEWARIIDKIRLRQRKYERDAMNLGMAIRDRGNIEKMEQVSLRHQVSHLAYSDTETDMRVIKLALKYESDPAVLEKTLDEMQNRYEVRNTTEIEDVINTMLDIEPQIFTTHYYLLETIMTIKHSMDARRTYRPRTITDSDGQPEFVLPSNDSCIEARKQYSKYSSMWDTIKNWRDTRTYDDVIAPLVDRAVHLDFHDDDIDFNIYEE